MSSLIVLLPSGGSHAVHGWETAPMPFALLDRSGEALRVGRAPLDALPHAAVTVLIVAARDTLLLNVSLPPVTGQRLQRVLPNVVEEHLIQDAQRSHVAVAPAPDAAGERCAAVIQREWFAAVIDRFVAAGHRRLRAVPLIHCMPLAAAGPPSELDELAAQQPDADLAESASASEAALEEPSAEANAESSTAAVSALIVRHACVTERIDGVPIEAGDAGAPRLEVAVRQGMLGFGMTIDAAQLDATIAELAKRQALVVYSLSIEAVGEQPDIRSEGGAHNRLSDDEPSLRIAEAQSHPGAAFPLAALTLPWVKLAREALACRFDLCQFEFAHAGRAHGGAGGIKPWRVALGFVAASLVVSLIAVNVQWMQLRHRRDALTAQMTQLVQTAVPGTTVILDPHAQMASELARLRTVAGDLRPDDFPALAAGVARALGPVPSSAIAGLDYSGSALDLTFKPGTTVDGDGLTRRLAAQSLSAQEDNGKWTIKSGQAGPH